MLVAPFRRSKPQLALRNRATQDHGLCLIRRSEVSALLSVKVSTGANATIGNDGFLLRQRVRLAISYAASRGSAKLLRINNHEKEVEPVFR